MAKNKKRKGSANIFEKAKEIRKSFPHRYDRLKNPWRDGYVAEASARYAKGHKGKSPVGKKRKVGKRHKVAKKKTARKRAKRQPKNKIVKRVAYESTIRAVGKKRKRRHTKEKKVTRYSGRKVGGTGGGTGLLLGLGLGLGALYLLSRPKTPTTTSTTYPPLQSTSNATRNTQAQDIVSYAIAAGLVVDDVIKLINNLNSSSDSEVQTIYDSVDTNGDVGAWV